MWVELGVQVSEHFTTECARGPIAFGDEEGVLEDTLFESYDRGLAIAHAVLRRIELVPTHLRPKGFRSKWITCQHCGVRTERDARSRFCSADCRTKHSRPIRRQQRGKQAYRKRCTGREENGHKCRRYPPAGKAICLTHAMMRVNGT